MNEWFERFAELPFRQRVLAVVAVVGLLFLGYAYLVYWPAAQEITAKESRLARLQKDRARKANLAANLKGAHQEVKDLRAALKEAVAQLPDTKEIPDLLSAISGAGRESGLEILQFRQKQEEYEDFYAEVPVEMLVRGSYSQVEEFFARVSQLQRIVNIRNISLKSPDLVPEDPVRLEIACSATTFRFLEEEERERIRREREAKKKSGKHRKRRGR